MNRLNQSTANRMTDPSVEFGVLTTAMLARADVRAAQGEGASRQHWRFQSLPALRDDGTREVHRSHTAQARGGSSRSPAALADESLRDRRFRAGSLLFYRD